MTNHPSAAPRDATSATPYASLAADPRYGVYVQIPDHLYRVLRYMRAGPVTPQIYQRLHAYYLFIGVADDIIDAAPVEIAAPIMRLLDDDGCRPLMPPAACLAAEELLTHIDADLRRVLRPKFEELYEVVVAERYAATMDAYIAARLASGRLTAEISYLLIRPLLTIDPPGLGELLQDGGGVGTLIDSVVDMPADAREGLLNFRPTLAGIARLALRTAATGLVVLARHPRLLALFIRAIIDNGFGARGAKTAPAAPVQAQPNGAV